MEGSTILLSVDFPTYDADAINFLNNCKLSLAAMSGKINRNGLSLKLFGSLPKFGNCGAEFAFRGKLFLKLFSCPDEPDFFLQLVTTGGGIPVDPDQTTYIHFAWTAAWNDCLHPALLRVSQDLMRDARILANRLSRP